MKPKKVSVNDRMQHGYVYYRTVPEGAGFDPRFLPGLTPKQMLELGVFGGKYMTDCRDEFPNDWFVHAKLSPEVADLKLNFLVWERVSRFVNGGGRIGYIRMIRGDGFSGIVGIILGGVCRKRTAVRLPGGSLSGGM